MSLSQRIADFKPPMMGLQCLTCQMVEALSEEDRAAFAKACADPRISNTALSKILREEGYQIGDSALRRHRKGECRGGK
jgi:hypothetical protein